MKLTTKQIHDLAGKLALSVTPPALNKFLHKLGRKVVENQSTGDALKRRQELSELIASKEQQGLVAIVYGGRDCDMVQWDNRVAVVPATVTFIERWVDIYMEAAEGPQWWSIDSLSEVRDLEPSRRDLALEAHEDGHPHVVYA